jgi:hypothetical protein
VLGGRTRALAQGLFNVVSRGWALLHPRSFEAVLGTKTDWWLVQTVPGLLVPWLGSREGDRRIDVPGTLPGCGKVR